MKNYIIHKISNILQIPVVGVDISDRTFKFLKLNFNGKIEFSAFGEMEIPAGIIEEGEIKNEDGLIEILKKWRKENSRALHSCFVVASLPEEKSFVHLIQIPNVKREEIGSAIRWEIEANIPLPPENLAYDYDVVEPIQGPLDHLDIVVTAFPKLLVQSYTSVFRNAGITLAALELESQAIVRAIVETTPGKTAKIIVDIGKTRTSFIIFAGTAIIFTSTIQLGGNTFEDNISRVLVIDLKKAREIKEQLGLNRQETNKKVFEALAPSLSVLADELKRVVSYYQEHTSHLHGTNTIIEEVLLVGGDANLFGIDTFVASALQIPVKHADPFLNIRNQFHASFPPMPKNELLAFATAIGLSLRKIV